VNFRAHIAARPISAIVVAVLIGAAAGLFVGLDIRPAPAPPDTVKTQPPQPQPPPALRATFTPIDFAAIDGWQRDPLDGFAAAIGQSCKRLAVERDQTIGIGPAERPTAAWRSACDAVRAAGTDANALRAAIETSFIPHRVGGPDGEDGTFTGYYEATLNGSLTPDARFKYPLFAPPADLINVALKDFVPGFSAASGVPAQIVGRVDGRRLAPYHQRAVIDADAFRDKAEVIAWIDDPVAVHILHIQGSGQVTLPDGTMIRVGFAAHNGHAFTGLGKILLDEGVLKPGEASMIGVREWLGRNPARAQDLMNRNARYIFFRRIDGDGPIGAEGVPLTPLRSLAVDSKIVPLGAPIWVDTVDPDNTPLQRLMMTQDIGAAIQGAVRGDVFWGAGEPAFAKAARMKSKGRAILLLPRV